MRKETDLEAVKRVAKTFVYLDIQINEQVGFLVNHPFIGEIAVVVKENGKLVLKDVRKEEDLAIVRQNIVNTIDAVTNFQQFIHIVRAPYLPAFFKFTHHFLSLNDYSSFLGSMWTIVEFPNVDDNIPPQEFVRIFRMADKSLLMNDEERRLYLALPDEMTVYRGIRGRGSLKALSWTTDIEQAEWFAKRWDKKGKVYSAMIRKEDVLSMFTSRGESEVVVDYTKLKNIVLEREY
jgi:hypothetical protein